MPRMTALHMLRSTISTVSAPANSSFRAQSHTPPTQPLCTLRVRRYRRLTQHSLPGDLLGLTWAGLAPADRASFAGAFTYSITSSAVGFVNREMALAGLQPISRSVYCTKQGYQARDFGDSASLNSVCKKINLARAGALHGALEDAWLAASQAAVRSLRTAIRLPRGQAA